MSATQEREAMLVDMIERLIARPELSPNFILRSDETRDLIGEAETMVAACKAIAGTEAEDAAADVLTLQRDPAGFELRVCASPIADCLVNLCVGEIGDDQGMSVDLNAYQAGRLASHLSSLLTKAEGRAP